MLIKCPECELQVSDKAVSWSALRIPDAVKLQIKKASKQKQQTTPFTERIRTNQRD